MTDLNLFCFAASSREGSYNQRLLNAALAHVPSGVNVDHEPDYEALALPNFEDGITVDKAETITQRISKADALMIASPEYNWSMPGSLKNIIDWVSRVDIKALNGTPILLMCASPSVRGGVVGLTQLRVPLEVLGAWIYPQLVAVGRIHETLDDQDRIIEEKDRKFLELAVTDFVSKAKTLKTTL